MGLMQLLTVGRSLDEARDRPHRYKLLSGGMPTFGHARGMRAGPKSSLGTAVAGEPQERAVEPEERGSVGTTTIVGDQMMKAEAADGTAKAATAFPLGRWALKANPFKSPAQATAQPVVQGELSLEKVKVVRNDLSDSDLELVAASQPAKAAAPQAENVFAAGAKKPSLLVRLKSRLFRAKAR
jgi:hypothetical protein